MAGPFRLFRSPRTPSLRLQAPVLWFTMAFLVLTLSTVVAWTQSSYPGPYREPRFLTLGWWRFPVERNAFQRLDEVTADLNHVFMLPGTDQVWAVGNRGLILHSQDHGRAWVQRHLREKPAAPTPRTSRWPADLIPEAHAQVPHPAPGSPPLQHPPLIRPLT